jgi:hypothetical protein
VLCSGLSPCLYLSQPTCSISHPIAPPPLCQVEGPAEVQAWRIAACLIHPLDPKHTGATPASLLHVSSLQALLVLADKFNMQVWGVCGGDGWAGGGLGVGGRAEGVGGV